MGTNIKTLDLKDIRTDDTLATNIANTWLRWQQARRGWEKEKLEIRNYVFATDTKSTSNSKLPWKNSTHLPKLCQIRDNLHANYMASLFPHDDWFIWEGAGQDDVKATVRTAIESYMRQKLRESGFYDTMSKIVLDYIDYGVCFGEVSYEHHVQYPDDSVEGVVVYSGPLLTRISPMDVVFDITASTFSKTPKITRTLMTLGQLAKMAKVSPSLGDAWALEAYNYAKAIRTEVCAYQSGDVAKNHAMQVDGFGSLYDYYQSGTVEILEFEGDIYDTLSGDFLENHKIIVIDRDKVMYKQPFTTWTGTSNKHCCTWRDRPDNLMGMGPLDNIVGLQYRIDHLENLKADVFDQIANPVVKQKGYVETWNWGPGERIVMDVESDVDVLRPDATALNADMQIERAMNTMEEMAGAPRQAMGIRTPGEKTAFEVSELGNAASRTFIAKLQQMERNFLEPVLSQFLAAAQENLIGRAEAVRVIDDETGLVQFLQMDKRDIKARGKLYPKGAQHFARKAQLTQNLMGLANSALYADPAVQAHLSGFKLAKAIEELLEFDRFGVVEKDIRVNEAAETQAMSQQEQQTNMQTAMVNPDMEEPPIA